jgi:hypothetical protein
MKHPGNFQGSLRSAGLAMLLLVAITPAYSADQAPGLAKDCQDGGARVVGANETDLADICEGVSSARSFFASHGIRPTEPVAIEVSPKLPAEAGPTAAGCYVEQRRRVFVVPYATFQKNKTWFGVSINRAIYRSLAAHEAGHAIAACHFRIPNPTIQAKEYLAYVAMFSAMAPELRAKALKGARTEGFTSLDRFTPLLYMFDPMRFGGEAYRHYSKVSDATALVEAILAGKELVD